MALADILLPSQRTGIPAGAFQDDDGRWYVQGDEGRKRVQREENFDPNFATIQDLMGAGYFPLNPALNPNGMLQQFDPKSIGYLDKKYGQNFRSPLDVLKYEFGNPNLTVENDPRFGALVNVGGNALQPSHPLDFGSEDNSEFGQFLGAVAMAAGGAAGLAGLGLGGVGGLGELGGFGATGLTEGALAGEAGFLPGSFDLGASGGLGSGLGSGLGGNMSGVLDFFSQGINPDFTSLTGGGSNMQDLFGFTPDLGGGPLVGSQFDPGILESLTNQYPQGPLTLEGWTTDLAGGQGMINQPPGTANYTGGNYLSDIAQKLQQLFQGGGTGPGPAGGLLSKLVGSGTDKDKQGLISSILGTAAGTIPSALLANYAMNQQPDLSYMKDVYARAGANAPNFIQAAQDPLQQAQAAGYGDLLQSQANRGIRGSSFGDAAIGNYLNTTNRGIAGAGINAAQSSLGIQSQLAQAIPKAQASNLAAKLPILGAAASGIGTGLQSQSAQNLGNYLAQWFPGLLGPQPTP